MRRVRALGSITHLYCARTGDGVCEVAAVEVGLETADGNDELRTLDLLLDFRTTDRANVELRARKRLPDRLVVCTHATVTFMVLAHGSLPHGCSVNRESSGVNELQGLIASVVPNAAGVNEDDNVAVSRVDELGDFVNNEGFDLWIVGEGEGREWYFQALGGDLLVCDVGGEGKVDGARLGDALCEDTVDLRGSGVDNGEVGGRTGELFSSEFVRVVTGRHPSDKNEGKCREFVPAVSKSVVQHRLRFLLVSGGYTGDV